MLRRFVPLAVTILAFAHTTLAAESLGPITCRLVEQDGRSHLLLRVGGSDVVSPDSPLYSGGGCAVAVSLESVAEGCLLHYRITSDGGAPEVLPDLHVSGISLPREGVELIENWKNVRFRSAGAKGKTRDFLHPVRTYPGAVYSPVMGIRADSLFLGASLLFEPLKLGKEVHLDYRYDNAAERWSMLYRFWDDPVVRVPVRDQTTGEERMRPRIPPPGTLGPGETLELTLALCVAPADGDRWVAAFRPYRDFFRQTYGEVRYTSTREPIWARSMGISELVSEDNPRGYNSRSSGDLQGRLDQRGWTGFHDEVMREVWGRGFRRMMIWQVAGSYRQHPNCNMVWEIGTGHSPKMLETAGEIERLRQAGFTVGFWWGRAFSPSAGFDSGIRYAMDPDNSDHVAWSFRELDAAHRMGVRLIGCDDSPHSLQATEWKPDLATLCERWFPVLYERYPDVQWAIETAACDLQHVWGSSFMWSREVTGPCTFAHYVVPGSESNVAIKRRCGETTQEWLDQLLRWGYTPIVFNDTFKLRIDRSLLPPDTSGGSDAS